MSDDRDYRLMIDSMMVVLFCFLGNWTWDNFLTTELVTPLFPESWRTLLIYSSFYATVPAIVILLFPHLWLLRIFVFFGSLGIYLASFEFDSQSTLFLMPVLSWQLLLYGRQKMTVSIIRQLAFNTSLILSALTLYSFVQSLRIGENPLFTFTHALMMRVALEVSSDPFSQLLSSHLKFLLPLLNGFYLLFFAFLPLVLLKARGLRLVFLGGALYPVFTFYFLHTSALEWSVLFLPLLLILAFRPPKMA